MLLSKRLMLIVLVVAVFVTSGCTTYQGQGGMAGGAMGGLAGAVLDRRNPWRGGVVGAVLGSLAGATISEVSAQGARESARAGQPVEYRTEAAGPQHIYRAEPVQVPANVQTRCRKVRERVYEGDRLIKDNIKEVCEGDKFERSY
jgi:hypothetical protein